MKKWFYLVGYFVMMFISAFSLITDLILIFSGEYLDNTPWNKIEMILFVVAFVIIFAVSGFLFIVWLKKILKDISINKENK